MASRVGPNNYIVQMGSKKKTYHMNMLRKHITREHEVDVVPTSYYKGDDTVAVASLIYLLANSMCVPCKGNQTVQLLYWKLKFLNIKYISAVLVAY